MGYFKYFFFFFLSFSIVSILCLMAERSYMGGSDQSVFQPLFSMASATSSGEWGKLAGLVFTNFFGIFQAIGSMFIWNYTVFDSGVGEVVRYALLWPLSAAMVFSLFITTSSLVRGGGG